MQTVHIRTKDRHQAPARPPRIPLSLQDAGDVCCDDPIWSVKFIRHVYQGIHGPKGFTLTEVSALGETVEIDTAGGKTWLWMTFPVSVVVIVLIVCPG